MTKKIPKISTKVAKEIVDIVKDFTPESYDKGLIRIQYWGSTECAYESYYHTNDKWISDDDVMLTSEEVEDNPELQDEYNRQYNLWDAQNDKIYKILKEIDPISKGDFQFITIVINKDNIKVDIKVGWDDKYHRYWYYKYLKNYPKFLKDYCII